MSEKLYSLEFVQEMSGGNEEFTKQLIELFIESVPESIEKINKFYEDEEYEKLGKEAHKLKSTIQTVQIPSFIEKIKDMEHIGKTGEELDKLPGLMKEFNEIMPKAVEQIKSEV
ncbi:Hpt domain-containing protein [Salibacter halophilus]|jgi:HPt (histidine-containing phosphotransfer) domain-containing protein|uniref:Hpt domain-containing protein n=1 Tax=Salibacter halophilus TaxID=1803916 RepID=A0A6N6MCV8_9FLAO|nr:Hpt domain-containing protein [Salibacter halophilus]KAB1065238.1 Hpt domain-containing protein [Salibacter halophilus]